MTQAPVLNNQILDQIIPATSEFIFVIPDNIFSDADAINPFQNLVIFGDSLSDTGNIFEQFENSDPKPPGYPSPPYYQGRFSNGPNWVDYLTSNLAFNEESVQNFAYGGSKTGEDNIVPGFTDLPIPALLTQIQLFTNQNANTPVSEDTLYVIWSGHNDFNFLPPEDYTEQGITDAAINAVTNVNTAITTLSSLGAKEIVVANLPDLNARPLESPADGRQFSLVFNNEFNQDINELESNLNVDISLVDVFSLNEAIQANPGDFDFTDLTTPLILETGDVNQDEYLYWDTVHPTTRGHQLISQTFAETLVEEEIIPDLITYSATLGDDSQLPDWLEFNPITQTFSGTPTDENAGIFDIKVTATDTEGLTATDNFSLVVERTNPTIVVGTPEADKKVAGVDLDGINNTIFTGAGNDEVEIPTGGRLAGNNRIATGSDDDIILVGDRDRAFGGSGNDKLDGTDASHYRLSGGSGDDTFYLGKNGRALGGDGEDQFFVQEGGNNIIAGGEGADKFWVANVSLPTSKNTITDFTIGVDKIHLSGFENLNFGGITREQMGADTLLKLDTSEIALLVGINADSLTANDFDFVASVI